ncbi:Bro-N domain-containing protein [Candidatus Saccharibacteria bacterium]|nr:Bro-N domain-containing protein [Candidatus Saccharibacteria bacterium]
MSEEKMQLFEQGKVRSVWDELREEWYFSVVDVVKVLTEQNDALTARKYWNKLKQRLKEEGSELVTNCHQLKMTAEDGRKRLTDAMTAEQLLRLVQSVPSKKAEPFKLWLAQVGRERIDETIDPELAMERAVETYQKKGYSDDWIRQRLMSIKIRNGLTNEWRVRGVKKGAEYAILTDEISKAWSGMTTREYKNLKGLRKGNLRDNMSDMELVLTMLSEATTTELEKQNNPKTLDEHKKWAKSGGEVAGVARKEVETRTGKKIITSNNAERLNPMKDLLEGNFIEE